MDLRGSGVIPSPTLQGSEPSGEVPPIPAPYLQCPQLLLDQPHTLLGVQVVHGEGAHILLGGRGRGWGWRQWRKRSLHLRARNIANGLEFPG